MQVEVTDADREAAASGYFAWCSGNPVIPDRMKAGTADDHSMVQAFARHRIAERERVVGEVVEWLWANNDYADDDEREYKEFLVNQIAAKFGGRDAG